MKTNKQVAVEIIFQSKVSILVDGIDIQGLNFFGNPFYLYGRLKF